MKNEQVPPQSEGGMRYRVLDLFCGAGGSAVGLHQVGFEVVGIDIEPQPRYPFEFHQADAMTYPLEGFDAYWASPPCQAYADTNKGGGKPTKHPRLIEPIRLRLQATGKPYIIENIHLAPLNVNLVLCGTSFGLRVIRHRYFELNFPAPPTPLCNHWGTVAHGDFVGVYARGGKGPRHGRGVREPSPRPANITPEEAMGIDWMIQKELAQAIPPVYANYLGKALLVAIREAFDG